MENKLDLQKKVLLLKSGLRYFLLPEEVDKLNLKTNYIQLQGDIISTSTIEGIFNPDKVEEADKRRRGMWKCKYNKWHNKMDNCECGRMH